MAFIRPLSTPSGGGGGGASVFTNTRTSATYSSLQSAHDAAISGDTIQVTSNSTVTGSNAVAEISKTLTITGVGTRSVLNANGSSVNDHGILDVISGTLTVNNIEFKNSTSTNGNGAGIWVGSGLNLTVTDCKFTTCQNGILTGNSGGTITLTRCEMDTCGSGDGVTHGAYIGIVDSVTATACFFHDAIEGHNFKTRAKVSTFENCYFMDGTTGTSSYILDVSNGGDLYLRGCCLQKGVNAVNSTAVIAYAQEGFQADGRTNRVRMIHNTLVNKKSGGSFLVAPAGTSSVTWTANWFCGNSTSQISGGFALGSVTQTSNVVGTHTDVVDPTTVSSPDFSPTYAKKPGLMLTTVPDATRTKEAMYPLQEKNLLYMNRWVGANQRRKRPTWPAWRQNLAANTWITFNNTKLVTNGGAGSGICSYSSGVAARGKVIIGPGYGHTDGNNNHVLSIDFLQSTPAWSTLVAESSTKNNDAAYNPDGKPAARHSYDDLTYIPSLDKMMSFACSIPAPSSGTYLSDVDGLNVGTGTWDAAGTYTPAYADNIPNVGGTSCISPDETCYIMNEAFGQVMRLTLGSTTVSGVSGSGTAATYDKMIAFDPVRWNFVQFLSPGYSWDCTSSTLADTTLSLPANAQSGSWDWCPQNGKFLGVHWGDDGGTVYQCNPASSYATSTLSLSGTAPTGFAIDGIGNYYGRFMYSEDLEMFFWVYEPDHNVVGFAVAEP